MSASCAVGRERGVIFFSAFARTRALIVASTFWLSEACAIAGVTALPIQSTGHRMKRVMTDMATLLFDPSPEWGERQQGWKIRLHGTRVLVNGYDAESVCMTGAQTTTVTLSSPPRATAWVMRSYEARSGSP